VADIAVWSGAGGAGNGSSWANAYTTLAAALAGAGTGNTFWLRPDHAEVTNAQVTLAFSTTVTAPTRVYCAGDTTTWPPTARGTGAAVATGAGAYNLNATGHVDCYGVAWQVGVGGGSTVIMQLPPTAGAFSFRAERCIFDVAASTSGSNVRLGISSSSENAELIDLVNCQFRFAHSGQHISTSSPRVRWRNGVGGWTGVAVDVATATPTAFLRPAGADMELWGLDLSNLSSNALVDISGTRTSRVLLAGCRLSSTHVRTTGSALRGGVIVDFHLCDDGAGQVFFARHEYAGVVEADTGIYRDGGAESGSGDVPWSLKAATSAGCSVERPLRVPLWPIQLPDDAGVTVTAELALDRSAAVDDDEAWIEVDYPVASGHPLLATALDRLADPVTGTPAAQAASSETWTGTGGWSNPQKRTLGVAVTPGQEGPVRATAVLAVPSITAWLCPRADVA